MALLKAEVPAVGQRVYKHRSEPLRTWQLPCITVYSENDAAEPDDSDSVDAVFTHTLTIVGWTTADTDLDDKLDNDLAEPIEKAMAKDRYLNGTAAAAAVRTATVYGENISGERPMGAVALTYDVAYRVPDRAAATPEDDFDTAGVTTDISGEQAPADRLTSVMTDIYEGGP